MLRIKSQSSTYYSSTIFNIITNKVGVNNLRIDFQSPVEYAENQWNNQSRDYPVFPECVPPEYQGECHANHIRKMQGTFYMVYTFDFSKFQLAISG